MSDGLLAGVLHLFCLYQTDIIFWLCLLNEPLDPFLLSQVCCVYEFNRDERLTSLIEWLAWFKCSDTGVVVLSCW